MQLKMHWMHTADGTKKINVKIHPFWVDFIYLDTKIIYTDTFLIELLIIWNFCCIIIVYDFIQKEGSRI